MFKLRKTVQENMWEDTVQGKKPEVFKPKQMYLSRQVSSLLRIKLSIIWICVACHPAHYLRCLNSAR